MAKPPPSKAPSAPRRSGPRSDDQGATTENPARQRLTALLDRWQTSLDIHAGYASLDDGAYWQARSWPPHDRPSPWILKLASEKLLELRQRISSGGTAEADFMESLELMNFLSTLVGLQNIKRFIPLVDRSAPEGAASDSEDEAETTREMPQLKPEAKPRAAKQSARRPAAEPSPAPATAPVAATAKSTGRASSEVQEKIIADAVRLLKWGRHWHELAELIERIADRPAVAEIRRVLRDRKADIEKQANVSRR